MFISDNIIHFFGRRLNVLNFSRKKYLNKKAQKRYRENYREFMAGYTKGEIIDGEKYVVMGLHNQIEIDKLIEMTNLNLNSSFYTYLRDPTIDVSKKQENLKIVYVSYNGTQEFDNTVYYGVRGHPRCPKFLTKRPCDTCMKCVSEQMEIPKKVVDFLF